MPGCYPTAAQLALKPLMPIFDLNQWLINATSGVSGAGRKAAISSFVRLACNRMASFPIAINQRSPTPRYGVIFTPHLGNFRGILENHYLPPGAGVSQVQVAQAFGRRMPINHWCGCRP